MDWTYDLTINEKTGRVDGRIDITEPIHSFQVFSINVSDVEEEKRLFIEGEGDINDIVVHQMAYYLAAILLVEVESALSDECGYKMDFGQELERIEDKAYRYYLDELASLIMKEWREEE